jgi:predicted kinase
MRKWMRERVQRRKKKDPDEAAQPAPPPLQPAYFDADQAPEGESERVEVSESRTSHEAEAEPQPASADPAEEKESSEPASETAPERPSAAGQRGRGRRRRGGRGRSGRGREQGAAAATTAAAAPGSVPGPRESAEGAEIGDSVEGEVPPPASASPSVPAAASAAQRPPKGIVVLAIGLPGSGKSSWFKRHNVVPLSTDMVRSLLFDDIREQRFQDLVFSNLRSMLKARLIAKRPMNYVDATNLTPQERQHWIKLAKDYNYEVHAVFFDVPLDVCIDRHQRRDRVVPEDVMRRMAAKLKAPAFTEGFAKITVVRVKKKD